MSDWRSNFKKFPITRVGNLPPTTWESRLKHVFYRQVASKIYKINYFTCFSFTVAGSLFFWCFQLPPANDGLVCRRALLACPLYWERTGPTWTFSAEVYFLVFPVTSCQSANCGLGCRRALFACPLCWERTGPIWTCLREGAAECGTHTSLCAPHSSLRRFIFLGFPVTSYQWQANVSEGFICSCPLCWERTGPTWTCSREGAA